MHDEYCAGKDVWELPSQRHEAHLYLIGVVYNTAKLLRWNFIWKCTNSFICPIVHSMLFWKVKYIYIYIKTWLYLQQTKVLIPYCKGNPVRAFNICSVTLGISTQLQAPWKFSLKTWLSGSLVFVHPNNFWSCLREEGIYIRRIFFSVSRSSAQEKAGTQGFVHHQGFALSLSCSWFYRSYFLYGNLIKKVIPSEHKAITEQ